MRKSTLLTLAVMTAITFTLTGCGNSTTNTAGTTSEPVIVETPVPTETTEVPTETTEVPTEEVETAEVPTEDAEVPTEDAETIEAPVEEATTDGELPEGVYPMSALEGKSLVITAQDMSFDLLEHPWCEYRTGQYGFDFEVLGVKGNTDLSTGTALRDAFITYFGEPTLSIEDPENFDFNCYQWNYEDGSCIHMSYSWDDTNTNLSDFFVAYGPQY